ncbi:MAG: hypothetical protein ACKVIW_14730, partial [bacterium]
DSFGTPSPPLRAASLRDAPSRFFREKPQEVGFPRSLVVLRSAERESPERRQIPRTDVCGSRCGDAFAVGWCAVRAAASQRGGRFGSWSYRGAFR